MIKARMSPNEKNHPAVTRATPEVQPSVTNTIQCNTLFVNTSSKERISRLSNLRGDPDDGPMGHTDIDTDGHYIDRQLIDSRSINRQ